MTDYFVLAAEIPARSVFLPDLLRGRRRVIALMNLIQSKISPKYSFNPPSSLASPLMVFSLYIILIA
jgi:hypothetical protein